MSAPKMFRCNHPDCGKKFTTVGAMNMHAKALGHDSTGKTQKKLVQPRKSLLTRLVDLFYKRKQ